MIDVSQPSFVRAEMWTADNQPMVFTNRIVLESLSLRRQPWTSRYLSPMCRWFPPSSDKRFLRFRLLSTCGPTALSI